MGTDARLKQLELILDNIISAYQETTTYRIPRTSDDREDDIWIIAGDFNATEDSEEISLVKRMGFFDGNKNKKLHDEDRNSLYHRKEGTKWSLNMPNLPPVVVDYIFCGLERITFPVGLLNIEEPSPPYRPKFTFEHENYEKFETDHAVLFASFKI